VRFPMLDIRGFMKNEIIQKETGEEKKIENTIPHKYYPILKNAIQKIQSCRLSPMLFSNDHENGQKEEKIENIIIDE